jgi:hypothetical protein
MLPSARCTTTCRRKSSKQSKAQQERHESWLDILGCEQQPSTERVRSNLRVWHVHARDMAPKTRAVHSKLKHYASPTLNETILEL